MEKIMIKRHKEYRSTNKESKKNYAKEKANKLLYTNDKSNKEKDVSIESTKAYIYLGNKVFYSYFPFSRFQTITIKGLKEQDLIHGKVTTTRFQNTSTKCVQTPLVPQIHQPIIHHQRLQIFLQMFQAHLPVEITSNKWWVLLSISIRLFWTFFSLDERCKLVAAIFSHSNTNQ